METLESGNKKNDIHDHWGEVGASLRERGSRAIPQRQFSASFVLMGYPPPPPPSPPRFHTLDIPWWRRCWGGGVKSIRKCHQS